MKQSVNAHNYTKDSYHSKVVAAVEELLAERGVVAPVDVFVKLGLLDELAIEEWRSGRAACLQQVLRCHPNAVTRILEILRLHAHAARLKATRSPYLVERSGQRYLLRFSSRDDPAIEKAFSRHFVSTAMAAPDHPGRGGYLLE